MDKGFEPSILKVGLLDLQACVPESWTDDEATIFVNKEAPTGILSSWSMKHNGNEFLYGCEERVNCASRDGFVHIMFQC